MNVAEVYLADGQKLATYDRATNDVQLEQRRVGCGASIRTVRSFWCTANSRSRFPPRAPAPCSGYVHILVPLAALYPDWRGYALITLAAIAAAVLVSYWLAARLQKQISGPIVNLAHTMQRVSSEEDY